MPEYLAPGVYIEEVSFRAKSIEGVSTSVAGFIGPTRYGPIGGPPELLTSFADFARIYGGLDQLKFKDVGDSQDNYMAFAVRAFFDNGGSKLYVTRVYEPSSDGTDGHAGLELASPPAIALKARFPGLAGQMQITFAVRTTANLLVGSTPRRVSGARQYDVVYIKPGGGGLGSVAEGLYDITNEACDSFSNPSLGTVQLSQLNPDKDRIHRVTLSVTVLQPGRFEDSQVWNDLSPDPNSRNSVTKLFTENPDSRLRYLTIPFAIDMALTSGAQLAAGLVGKTVLDAVGLNLSTDDELLSPPATRPKPDELQATYTLSGGNDGSLPHASAYEGEDGGLEKTGLKTFEDVDEISIVAAPGHSAQSSANSDARVNQIIQSMIIHCQERMRYRVAVLDSKDSQVVSEVQDFRGKLDSTHAALYYPWITILDPLDPDGRREINLPPSGFVAGIYARTDVLHGVFKAPANEVVLGAIDFETLLNKAQQDVLNPLGVNCFRFFMGRGFRLWGARTISSDPEWKYISVRRYFAYLEHSIDKGTQWAVFENNNEALWANISQTVTDFLFNEWRNGALMGTKPEEAFFVRCDRSTMTQNDLDNGRLICLIGVAVVKPAEFVIFRIGQFTADRKSS